MSAVNMSGKRQAPEDTFESLKAVFEHSRSKQLRLANSPVPGGAFLQKLLNAKGGDPEFNLGKLLDTAVKERANGS